MKNLKTTLYALLLVFPLWGLGGCKNDDDSTTNPIDQLPPATQTGENTFGCLVNGEPFVIKNSSNLSAIYQGGILQLSGNIGVGNNDETVGFNLLDPLEENKAYSLIENIYNSGYTLRKGDFICIYTFEDTFEGAIKFSKIDRINYTISGTFEFSTETDDCETINITNGRFDMQYIP